MKRPQIVPGLLPYLATLYCAAVLLPRLDRDEWLKEWTSELWYVYRDSVLHPLSWQGHRSVIDFCKGAFHDARELRYGPRPTQPYHVPHSKSATLCLSIMAVVTVIGAAIAVSLPDVRALFHPTPYRDTHGLMMIVQAGSFDALRPTISVEQYRSWKTRPQHLFQQFALYQPASVAVQLSTHNTRTLSVATTSPGLFPMLGIPLPSTSPNESLPSLLLSETAWKNVFHQNPAIIGTTIRVGDRIVKVVGTLPDNAWQLPGKLDAWIIDQQDSVPALRANSTAFVIARRSTSKSVLALSESFQMQVPNNGLYAISSESDSSYFDCLSLHLSRRRPFDTILFAIFLAFLALPATTSLPLGDYPQSRHGIPWQLTIRRWTYLLAKFNLILPIVFFFALDLSHLIAPNDPADALYIQLVSAFCICLFALRWTLRDQRSRCPVCLSRLANPVHVGEASRSFLAWNVTELICTDGHGLLHVPELPTCWFPTQRWLYLDPSWSSLFIPSI